VIAEIPSIWRTELWHPLIVHFPIALLIFATLIRVTYKLLGERSDWLLKSSRVLLYPGVVFAWAAVYTGGLADAEVVRSLCDPTVVETHETLAYTVGYLFTIALVLDLIDLLPLPSLGATLGYWKEWIVILLMVVGTAYLGYTAHIGAKLVYQQGAGVHVPTEECREFE
jgi:uncharacterized membrane protein